MYGAIPYLVTAFGVDRAEAFRIVCAWVDGEAETKADERARSGERPAADAPRVGSAARHSRAGMRKGKASGRRAA